ncbi:alpha/beta hydrolase [Cupriavidus sp. PET2-C1]
MTSSATERVVIRGNVGDIELLVNVPVGPIRGIAVITHPHPLQGGTAEHKVPNLFAKILASREYVAVRPNFRGVGNSEGVHDSGNGETLDVLLLIEHLRRTYPALPLVLAGFSFGAYVIARAAMVLHEQAVNCTHIVLAGTPWGTIEGQRTYETPPVPSTTLAIHGEKDLRVELKAVFDWARPQCLPIVVVPNANHFFTGKLALLERLVGAYLDHSP